MSWQSVMKIAFRLSGRGSKSLSAMNAFVRHCRRLRRQCRCWRRGFEIAGRGKRLKDAQEEDLNRRERKDACKDGYRNNSAGALHQ